MIKVCKNCKSEFNADRQSRKFCNQSCNATFNNSRRYGKKESRQCKVCEQKLGKSQRFTCSRECHHKKLQLEFVKKWLAGEIDGVINRSEKYKYNTMFSKRIKTYLMEQFNSQCEECGWDKKHSITGRVPLEVHHIDGDKYNNERKNLQLLCRNCHALTPNFRVLNS